MPMKRRMDKRRVSAAAEVAAWEQVFDTEFDFFGELRAFGVETDAHGCPPREVTQAAWHRLGGLFLDSLRPDPHREPWALATFGEPNADQA